MTIHIETGMQLEGEGGGARKGMVAASLFVLGSTMWRGIL